MLELQGIDLVHVTGSAGRLTATSWEVQAVVKGLKLTVEEAIAYLKQKGKDGLPTRRSLQ
jgi:hypothetical protein